MMDAEEECRNAVMMMMRCQDDWYEMIEVINMIEQRISSSQSGKRDNGMDKCYE